MRLPGFLKVGGTELANDVRTTAYLACQGWQFPNDCDCEVYDDGPYESVAADPAPWYVAAVPASAEFFGFLLEDVRLLSPFERKLTARGAIGASLGPLLHTERTLQVSGLMLGGTDRGMHYGETWLRQVLAGLCPHDVTDVCIAAHCQEGGMRVLRSAGLIDGPNLTSIARDIADYREQRVGFQIASELPYLYAEPDAIVDGDTLAAGGDEHQLVSTDEWAADIAVEIELVAGDTDATDLTVEARVTLDGYCPEDRTVPCLSMTIGTLPANSRLVIDTTRADVRWFNPIRLAWESGYHLVTFAGGFPWPVVPPCTDLCFAVANGGAEDVTLTMRTYGREL